jgi:cysteine desulfurase
LKKTLFSAKLFSIFQPKFSKMTIYLDNNATTAIDPDFIQDLSCFLSSEPMNASSVHTNGQKAKQLIQSSKQAIAKYLKVSPRELVFTSGGTESMNSLIFGIVKAQPFDLILTTKLEHACVYEACLELKKLNYPVQFIDLQGEETLTKALLEPFKLKGNICIITSSVNSETGAILPLEEVADFAKEHKSTLILDGVAQIGKMKISLHPGITAMGFSGHKIHAPKGIGFYYLKEGTPFQKLLFGGPQESQKRPGTENLFGILGLKLAIEKIHHQESVIFSTLEQLKKAFIDQLTSNHCHFEFNTKRNSVSNTVNLYFKDIDAETLLILLDQQNIATSMGSACASGALEPSRVLLEMGYLKNRAKQSLRFSFSRLNTKEEVVKAANILADTIKKMSI